MSQSKEQPHWHHWAQLVRMALQPGPPVDPAELLLVRDGNGRPYRMLEPPAGIIARQAAVLILLYPTGADLHIPLTIRSHHLPNHRGEISLPGGAIDPTDQNPAEAALREANEEIGLDPQVVEIWGMLAPIYTAPSNFQITPVVGMATHAPQLQINRNEVEAVITTTLRELIDPATVRAEPRVLRGYEAIVPFFDIAGQKVWGATAMILSELVARMRRSNAVGQIF